MLGEIEFPVLVISVIANLVLVYIVHRHGQAHISKTFFVLLGLVFAFWGVVNYFSTEFRADSTYIWWIRGVLTLAAPQPLLFFLFIYTFLEEKPHVTKIIGGFIGILLSALVALISSPYIFAGVSIINSEAIPVPGPAMPYFGFFTAVFIISGLGLLFKRYHHAAGIEKKQWLFIGVGLLLTFALMVTLNFVSVVLYGTLDFIKFGHTFTLPFVAFTAYAVLKHKLLNIKVVATELIAVSLSVLMLIQFLSSETEVQYVFNFILFVVVLMLSVLLVKSVIKEIEQRQELEKLAKKLSDFISFATHELRGPITAFKGAVSMIIEGNFGLISDESKKMLRKVYLEAEEMGQTVETFLNINKIEIGAFHLAAEKQDLIEVIQSAVEQSHYRAQEKGIDLKFAAPHDPLPLLVFDRFKIKHAVGNLISNAVKYNKEGGKVRVRVRHEEGHLVISVEDDGIGIPAENIPMLFMQYQRGSVEAQKFAEGSGIGLWLTKQIVDLHHGRVWVESDGPGRGSVFHIALPCPDEDSH